MIDHALEILSHQEIPIRITLSVHWLFLWDLCHPVYWSALIWTSVTLKILELSNILRDQEFREKLWGNWKPWKETIELRCLPWHGMFRKALLGCFVVGSQFVSECKNPHEKLHDKTRLFNAEKAVCTVHLCKGCSIKYYKSCRIFYSQFFVKMLVFPSIAHYSSLQILHQSSLCWKVVLCLAC